MPPDPPSLRHVIYGLTSYYLGAMALTSFDLGNRIYALATSINDRQVRMHANYSAGPSKWEHSARSALGCRQHLLSIFQCIEVLPLMTSYAIPAIGLSCQASLVTWR